MDRPLTRRRFLGAGALAALAAALPRQAGGAVVTRVLGRTKLAVTEVGMGVMLTSDPAVVRAALEGGVTYFDTARSYMGGRNEEILAAGLAGRRREVTIATKCSRLGSRDSVVASCEESLRALKTDWIDVFQLHGLSRRDPVLLPAHLEAIAELRRSGKIRFAGVTTHSSMPEVLDAAVEAGVYDMVLTVFNYRAEPVLVAAVERASAAGVGVVAMKVMSGGYAAETIPPFSPFQSALRWVLRHKTIATAIPSITTLEQARDNIAVMGTTFSLDDRLRLGLHAAMTDDRQCRFCGGCAGACPRGADVAGALRGLMYREGYGERSLASETLASLALPCGDCPSCTVSCRHGLPLPRLLAGALRLAENHDA